MERSADDVITPPPMRSENLYDEGAKGVDEGDQPLQDMLSHPPMEGVADVVEGVVGELVQELVASDAANRQASIHRAIRLVLLFLAICFSLGGYFIFLSFFDCHAVCQEIIEEKLKIKLQHSKDSKM